MKAFFALSLALPLTVFAQQYQIHGQPGTSYNQIGNFTYGSDGTTSQQIGNSTYYSNGTSDRQIGNTLYGSDRPTTRE